MAEYKFTMKNKNDQDQYDTSYPKIRLANILDYEPNEVQFLVNCPTGVVAQATNGSKSLSATSKNDVAKIVGAGYGTWTITVPGQKTVTVEVKELKQYIITFPALNEYSWDEISAASARGDAPNLFSIGDTKSIVLNGVVGNTTFNNVKIDVYILGIDHNASVEGNNRIHFCIGKMNNTAVGLIDSQYNIYPTSESGYFTMNYSSNTNAGGWNGCYMRSTIMPAIKNALPSDLQSVLKTVTKYTENTGSGSSSSSNVTATTETICLEAEFEVQGARIYANNYEQDKQLQYDYYKNGNSKIRYKYNDVNTAAYWWNRSPKSGGSSTFCYVGDSGGEGTGNSRRCYAIAPIFFV